MTRAKAISLPSPGALQYWLHAPQGASALWLGKHCVLVAWLGLLLAILSPPHGSGIQVCWFQSATGVPCPGCGLTRSLSCGIRGLFLESWHYHPLGLFILALFAFTALQSLLPQRRRQALSQSLQARPLFFKGLYAAFVVTFVLFGVARALWHCGQLFL
jgi:hypothetical protein